MRNFWAIGYDEINRITQYNIKTYNDNFPPYNIIKLDDNKHIIELSVPGFDSSTITITTDDDQFKVVGKMEPTTYQEFFPVVLKEEFPTIDSFEKIFFLQNGFQVTTSKLANGLLRIWLEHMTPKEYRKIPINDEPQLLNENA